MSVCHTYTVCPRQAPASNQAAIAQLGERQTEDLKVPSSILGLGTFVGRCNVDFVRTCGLPRFILRFLFLFLGDVICGVVILRFCFNYFTNEQQSPSCGAVVRLAASVQQTPTSCRCNRGQDRSAVVLLLLDLAECSTQDSVVLVPSLFFILPLAQGTEILQSTIPPEQAVDRTFSDLSTLGK